MLPEALPSGLLLREMVRSSPSWSICVDLPFLRFRSPLKKAATERHSICQLNLRCLHPALRPKSRGASPTRLLEPPPMRLLVTGGCGFVGSNFIRYVLQHYGPERVTNVDALIGSSNPANLDGVSQEYGDRYELIQGDVRDPQSVDAVFAKHHYYAVVNFATDPSGVAHPETPGPLMEVARKHGVRRFVQVSSTDVYDALPGSAFFEKARADELALAWGRQHGQDVVVTRSAPNYGPYQAPQNWLPNCIINVLKGRPLMDENARLSSRNWVHVEDHCAAVFAAMLDGKPGEIYDITSVAEMHDRDVLKEILEYLGKPMELLPGVQSPDLPAAGTPRDSQKIRVQLRWTPLFSGAKGIHQTVEWYRKNRGWWEPLLETRA